MAENKLLKLIEGFDEDINQEKDKATVSHQTLDKSSKKLQAKCEFELTGSLYATKSELKDIEMDRLLMKKYHSLEKALIYDFVDKHVELRNDLFRKTRALQERVFSQRKQMPSNKLGSQQQAIGVTSRKQKSSIKGTKKMGHETISNEEHDLPKSSLKNRELVAEAKRSVAIEKQLPSQQKEDVVPTKKLENDFDSDWSFSDQEQEDASVKAKQSFSTGEVGGTQEESSVTPRSTGDPELRDDSTPWNTSSSDSLSEVPKEDSKHHSHRTADLAPIAHEKVLYKRSELTPPKLVQSARTTGRKEHTGPSDRNQQRQSRSISKDSWSKERGTSKPEVDCQLNKTENIKILGWLEQKEMEGKKERRRAREKRRILREAQQKEVSERNERKALAQTMFKEWMNKQKKKKVPSVSLKTDTEAEMKRKDKEAMQSFREWKRKKDALKKSEEEKLKKEMSQSSKELEIEEKKMESERNYKKWLKKKQAQLKKEKEAARAEANRRIEAGIPEIPDTADIPLDGELTMQSAVSEEATEKIQIEKPIKKKLPPNTPMIGNISSAEFLLEKHKQLKKEEEEQKAKAKLAAEKRNDPESVLNRLIYGESNYIYQHPNVAATQTPKLEKVSNDSSCQPSRLAYDSWTKNNRESVSTSSKETKKVTINDDKQLFKEIADKRRADVRLLKTRVDSNLPKPPASQQKCRNQAPHDPQSMKDLWEDVFLRRPSIERPEPQGSETPDLSAGSLLMTELKEQRKKSGSYACLDKSQISPTDKASPKNDLFDRIQGVCDASCGSDEQHTNKEKNMQNHSERIFHEKTKISTDTDTCINNETLPLPAKPTLDEIQSTTTLKDDLNTNNDKEGENNPVNLTCPETEPDILEKVCTTAKQEINDFLTAEMEDIDVRFRSDDEGSIKSQLSFASTSSSHSLTADEDYEIVKSRRI